MQVAVEARRRLAGGRNLNCEPGASRTLAMGEWAGRLILGSVYGGPHAGEGDNCRTMCWARAKVESGERSAVAK